MNIRRFLLTVCIAVSVSSAASAQTLANSVCDPLGNPAPAHGLAHDHSGGELLEPGIDTGDCGSDCVCPSFCVVPPVFSAAAVGDPDALIAAVGLFVPLSTQPHADPFLGSRFRPPNSLPV